ncbi:pantoate--beta-alanine ligase [Idiomarina tyrosinivorans]|uniref:Pantothenate synthetase n=1 Tax=Idiomarina tyrosinivorans TaxID=1445662 RepID=A0A432ZRW2_9GAMM|nr:pantoate--beta-alanine ligase [Idiomarina tyrosinivorans]RUO80665.1 pantoate--beta-alanine ligase [Idiomarina tyrosinivorans]
MQQLQDLNHMRQWRRNLPSAERVALVPTMGNLHDGHLALVKHAQQNAERVVVSIFVNPMQFGANEDLDSYPRTLTEDCEKLASLGVDAVFTPTVDDVYPRGLGQQTRVEVPGISDILCGASRPGHFTGVATIVCKLFNMVQPDVAVFGQKDFQQLQVIRLMTADLSLPVEIIGVPTQRLASGLAMSSRNGYLSDAERQQASVIYQTLKTLAATLQSGGTDFSAYEQQAREALQQCGLKPDYVSIRNARDLSAPSVDAAERWVILIAAFLGKTRLIDNIVVARA